MHPERGSRRMMWVRASEGAQEGKGSSVGWARCELVKWLCFWRTKGVKTRVELFMKPLFWWLLLRAIWNKDLLRGQRLASKESSFIVAERVTWEQCGWRWQNWLWANSGPLGWSRGIPALEWPLRGGWGEHNWDLIGDSSSTTSMRATMEESKKKMMMKSKKREPCNTPESERERTNGQLSGGVDGSRDGGRHSSREEKPRIEGSTNDCSSQKDLRNNTEHQLHPTPTPLPPIRMGP